MPAGFAAYGRLPLSERSRDFPERQQKGTALRRQLSRADPETMLTAPNSLAAPLAYMGWGCLLLMNRMVARHGREWAGWVLFFTLGGFGGNFVLRLSDHAVNGFFRWSEWIPVISSGLATGFLLALLLLDQRHGFLWLTAGVLFVQLLVGGLGFLLHAWAKLAWTGG
jgi:hypothetical protein